MRHTTKAFELFHEQNITELLTEPLTFELLQRLADELISGMWKDDILEILDGSIEIKTTYTDTTVTIIIPSTGFKLVVDFINFSLKNTIVDTSNDIHSDEPLTLKDYKGIKLGQKYFPSRLKVTKSMQPYEVAKDAGSLWYFTMYDGSGSAIAKLWKTMTVDEFNKNWISADKVTPI